MALYPTSPGDVMELTCKAILFNQVILLTAHYQYTAATPAADGPFTINTALNQFTGGAGAQLGFVRGLQTADIAYTEARGQIVFPTRRPYVLKDLTGLVGTNGGTCKNSTDALFINKQSAIAKRGGHGGWHIAAVPVEQMASGVFLPAFLNTADLAGIALTVALPALLAGDGLWQARIWSPTPPATPSAIISTKAEREVRTMHRRTVGLGI